MRRKQRRTSYSRRKNHNEQITASLCSIFYLPVMFIYLEVIFHLYMGMAMKYSIIAILFGTAAGLILTVPTQLFHERINRILVYIITIVACLIYSAEVICKAVLQQYYQLFSTADTAANNSLLDYFDAIVKGIISNWFGLLLLFVPVIFIFSIGRMFFNYKQKQLAVGGMILVLAILIHILGVGTLYFSWQGDFTPKELYYSDTNVDDQVEQLGLLTMLRLDVKHTLFGVRSSIDDDEDLNLDDPVVTPKPSNTPEATTQPNEGDHSTITQVDTSPNIINFDLASLADHAKNNDVKWLSQYFETVTPTNKNQYTGMFQGYNVIFLTAEGFSKYLIDPERTPTLYKMANEGFVFKNYYTPLHYTSTSGGELQNLVGLYPKNGNPIGMTEVGKKRNDLKFTLANQLNQLGYKSIGFHNNKNMYGRSKSHPVVGYDWKQGGEGFEMEKTAAGNNVWPQSDLYMMEETVKQYINEDKFNVYYMTVSGHMPYNFTGDMMAVRNKDIVKGLQYSETTKAYIAANQELERALTYLNEQLEKAGKADNTLIVLSPDHIPYFDVAVLEELSGKNFGGDNLKNLKESDVDFDVYRNSLIIWSASMKEPIEVDKICTQVDILPTVSNLLGLKYDSRMLAGTDILSDASPLVIFSSTSWLTDKGLYNRYTGEFKVADGVTMTDEEKKDYVSYMKKIVARKLKASVSIIEQDYYKYLEE